MKDLLERLRERSSALSALIMANIAAFGEQIGGRTEQIAAHVFETIAHRLRDVAQAGSTMTLGPQLSRLASMEVSSALQALYVGYTKCAAAVLLEKIATGELAVPTTAFEVAAMIRNDDDALLWQHADGNAERGVACCGGVWDVLAASPLVQHANLLEDGGVAEDEPNTIPAIRALLAEGQLTEASVVAQVMDISVHLSVFSNGAIPLVDPDLATVSERLRAAFNQQLAEFQVEQGGAVTPDGRTVHVAGDSPQATIDALLATLNGRRPLLPPGQLPS
jgi:hypothetical protein